MFAELRLMEEFKKMSTTQIIAIKEEFLSNIGENNWDDIPEDKLDSVVINLIKKYCSGQYNDSDIKKIIRSKLGKRALKDFLG